MGVESKRYTSALAQTLSARQARATLRSGLVRGASGTFAFRIAWTGLGIATSLVLARSLGAKGYGDYAYAMSWAFLLSVPAVIGLDVLLTREVARSKAQSEWEILRGILSWSDKVVLLVSLGLMLTMGVGVWLLGKDLDKQTVDTLWVAMFVLPFLAFIRLRQGGIQGLGDVVEAQLPQMLILPVVFLALVGAAYFVHGLTALSAAGMRVLAAAVAFLIAVRILKKNLPVSARIALPRYRTREWLRSALPLLFVGAAGIINQRISVVMLGGMLGTKAAGIFEVAKRGATLVAFVLMAVNMPLAPTVAGLYAGGKTESLQRLVTKSARFALLGSLPFVVGMILFGRWVLLIFGKEFTAGTTALVILSLGQLVNAGMGSVALLLNMTGHERDTAKGVGIAALVNVVLNAVLIQVWGLAGAAVAEAASTATWNVLLAVWVYKRLGLCPTALGHIRSKGLP